MESGYNVQCHYPVKLRKDDQCLTVPCGRCRACRKAKAREWAVRTVHELGYHEKSVFATFTYSDENLPENGSLQKKAVQLMMKRLRKGLEGSAKIKYYVSGEYGEKNGRPHYHAIMFGIGPGNRADLEKAWPFGYVDVGTVTFESARYTANYVSKNYKQAVEAVKAGKEPVFQLSSKKFGERYAIENEKQIKEMYGVRISGKPCGLPRYYKKKCGLPTEFMVERAREHAKELEEHWNKHVNKNLVIEKTDDRIYNSIVAARWQAKKNLEAREALKEKKL